MITFDTDEQSLIRKLSVRGGWNHGDAKPLKRKIKKHFLRNVPAACCYCQLHMHRQHPITIDIEHVLPKSIYPQFTFEPRNLSLSCKRCNMGIKINKVSFYIGNSGEEDCFLSAQYAFIHPNLDDPKTHLQLITLQHNNNLLIKYNIINLSSKGIATYNFFKLNELEVNTFDDAQGNQSSPTSSALPEVIASQVSDLIKLL